MLRLSISTLIILLGAIEGEGPSLNKVCGAMPIMVVTDMISKEYREGGV